MVVASLLYLIRVFIMERKRTSISTSKYDVLASSNWEIKKVWLSWPLEWKEIICQQHTCKRTMAKQRFLQVHFLDKKYLVHRLVANAFLGLDLKNKSMVACHKDDNTENNNVENLFVWTRQHNSFDRFRFKVSKNSISQIRELINQWLDDSAIFDRFYNNRK